MFFLQRNLPAWERAVRLGGGLVLAFASVLWLPGGWPAWAGLAAALMMGLTGLGGFCPACALAGRKTVGKTRP